MHRRVWIQAFVGVLASGVSGYAGRCLAAAGQLQLRFNLNMTNPGPVELTAQRLWMYLPVQRNAWFRLSGIETSLPHEIQIDPLGHTILFASVERLAAYARRSASLIVTLERVSMPMPAVQDPQDWMAPERYIESDDSEIIMAASTLKADSMAATVRNIYHFVAAHLQYAGYIAEDLGAAYALRQRRGDCTEYACLVVALCRAAGIAARMVEGFVTDRSFAPRPMDYHDWAEVLVDGHWRVVDAQKGALFERESQYIPFRYYRDKTLNGVGSAHRYRVEGEMGFGV
ncbi:MAG: transglutaminase-like domain-containing protein [Betaproteobacteria bacterium]|nr:transglutaminase-like domain-containing protein [Betaproteobacteria bacterium]